MKTIRITAGLLALALILSSCGAADTPKKPSPTLAPEEFASKEPEPLDFESVFGCALKAYASSPLTDWDAEGLNRDRLDYNSEFDGSAYDFVFSRGGLELSCTVDRLSGEISNLKSKMLPTESYVPLDPATAEEEAAAAALGYFGIEKSEAEDLKVEFDAEKEPEFRHYFVGFGYGGKEYSCEMTSDGEFYTSNVDVGTHGARSLALNDFTEHIGSQPIREDLALLIMGGEIYDMIAGSCTESGSKSYRVSFKVGGYDIDYLISEAGEVIECSVEPYENWKGAIAGEFYSATERLSEHDALKIALEQAGVSPEEFSSPEVVYNDNYGYGFYSVSFSAGGKDYRYDIDAYTGDPLGSDI